MKKFLLISVFLFGLKSIGQVVLENYPSSTTSIFKASNFINYSNKMYYFGRTSGYQWSLYSTSGTSSGNQIVKPIGLQVANIISEDIDAKYNDYKIEYNSKLYFTAINQLWQSDGTTAGTALFASVSGAKYFKIFNGKLYFIAYGTDGYEVWSTDGTVAGTAMLKDIYAGSNSSVNPGRDPHFTIFNNKLFFVANDGINGYELWSSDGTTANTLLFMNLRVTESETAPSDQGAFTVTSTYSTQPFLVCNNKMYFVANSDFSNQYGLNFRLFQTDGTVSGTSHVAPPAPAGTSLTTNFISAVNGLTVINNDLFATGSIFEPSAGGGGGTTQKGGIFKVNNLNQVTQIGTIIPHSADSGSGADTEQSSMKLYNGEYYFIAPGTVLGSNLELWKMNPITLQFTQVSNPATPSNILFNTNNGFSRLLLSQEWNGKLYFMKADAVAGQLFSTTGTLSSTTQVAKNSITPNQNLSVFDFGSSSPKQLQNFISGLYFGANIGASQPSLWRFYDATLTVQENYKTNFSVFPNPTSSQINFSFDNNLENANIKITSLLGQTVLEKQNLSGNNLSFDVSNLAKGMYVVTVNNGGLVSNSKFIKE